jgi:hypothetical protein
MGSVGKGPVYAECLPRAIQRIEKTIRITTSPQKMSTVIVPIRSCSLFRLGVAVGGSSTATMVIVGEGDAVGEGDTVGEGVAEAVGAGEAVGVAVAIVVAVAVGIGLAVAVTVTVSVAGTVAVAVAAGVSAGVAGCVAGDVVVGVIDGVAVAPWAAPAAGAISPAARAKAPTRVIHTSRADFNDVCRRFTMRVPDDRMGSIIPDLEGFLQPLDKPTLRVVCSFCGT